MPFLVGLLLVFLLCATVFGLRDARIIMIRPTAESSIQSKPAAL
jgi:hypothetical protein